MLNWYSPDLEFAARLEHQHAADEHPGLIDHAFARQQVGDIADAEPARNIDHLVVAQRSGRFEALLADVKRAADGDRDHDQHREDRIADDHQRMAHPSGAARGGRHAFRLERGARTARGLAAGRRRDWHGARSARGSATLPAMRWIGTHAPAPAIATCKLTFDTLQFGDRSRAQSRLSGARLSPAAADSEIISSFRTLGRIMAKAWGAARMASRHSGGRSARHSFRRSRTSSTTRCRCRACAPHAAPDRSAFRPTDYRD